MDLRQIKCFVALVEEGSITGAARRLNVVQPAVSMSLRKLEDEFGVVLFDRTARGVVVSQKAHGLYEICLKILEQVAAAGQVLRTQNGQVETTTLAVGSLPSGGYSLMPKVLNEVCEMYPNCRVISRQGYNDVILDYVAQGILDVAVVSTVKQNERLPHEYLGSERLMLVGCSGSDIGLMPTFPASKLGTRRLVMSPVLLRRFEDDFARAGVEITPTLEVESAAAIFGVLRQPGWFSVLPASALCGSAASDFSATPLSEPTIERDRWLVSSRLRPRSEVGIYFRSAIRRALEENPHCTVAPEAGMLEDAVSISSLAQIQDAIAAENVRVARG